MHAARFLCEGVHSVLRLKKRHAVRACRGIVRQRIEVSSVFLIEKIARADDVDRDAGFLNDLTNFAVS